LLLAQPGATSAVWECPARSERGNQNGGGKGHETYDLIIIGGGAAGLTTAAFACPLGLPCTHISPVGQIGLDLLPALFYQWNARRCPQLPENLVMMSWHTSKSPS